MASTDLNKVALVTGSTSGIGLSTANVLAKEGCDIIITGFGSQEVIDSIKHDIIRSYGVKAHYISCDLRNVPEINNFVENVLKLYPKGIDILINNAGFNYVCNVEDYPDDKWDEILAVMLTAPFHLTKRFLPTMKKKGWGRIVNMSSQMGFISTKGKAVYSAAKTGLIGFTKGVALEVTESGITCNAVCPTFAMTNVVDTQIREYMEKNNTTYEQEKAAFVDKVPVKEFITPEQIADFIKYLCFSVTSPMMTGTAYLLDGGYTAQ